ncbi:MAG: hypothetical protein WB562_10860 [Candidatus Sulfotelmatobacter sp.]
MAPPPPPPPLKFAPPPPAPPPPAPPFPPNAAPHGGPAEINDRVGAHPKSSLHRVRHYLKIVTLVVLGGIALSAAYFYLHTPDPAISLDQVRLAYAQQDQLSFDKYVDVPAVLENGIDQFADYYALQHRIAHPVFFKAGISLGKQMYLPQIAQSVDNFVVTGNLPELPVWATDNATVSEAISDAANVLHRLIQAQLTYQGVVSETVSGADAKVEVRIRSPLSTGSMTVRLQMRRVHDHWRIVAIEDVPQILQEMGIQI